MLLKKVELKIFKISNKVTKNLTIFDKDIILKSKSAVRINNNLGNIFKNTFLAQSGMGPLKRVEREFTFKMITVNKIDSVTRTIVKRIYLPIRGTTILVAGMRS